MIISDAQFVTSSTSLKNCPNPIYPEYAFIGRSNVGKSSLINLLVHRNSLARISSKPGKTQTINHFLINSNWYLVDLPGLGYAKVSKSSRNSWLEMIEEYLLNRVNLLCVFVLIDSRIPPQRIDNEFIDWLGENQIPFRLVFTKTDKLSKNELTKNMNAFKSNMLERWDELPEYYISSAVSKLGREEILNFIETTNPLFKQE